MHFCLTVMDQEIQTAIFIKSSHSANCVLLDTVYAVV